MATEPEAAPVPQRPDRQSGQREQRALIREEYIVKFGFAIPNAAAIKAIQKHGPIVEVGSGSGYWTYELGNAGVDVVATDSQPGEYAAFFTERRMFEQRRWSPIEVIDGVNAVRQFPERNLLLVWPDQKNWAFQTLQAYTGDIVIYVGEGRGGNTADDAFHDLLAANFDSVERVAIPQFDGIHDYLSVFGRKRK